MKVRELFEKCLDIDDPAGRDAYLREACGGDVDLQKEVNALLLEHERTSSFFLDQKARQTTQQVQIVEKVGSQIGPYRLMEQIGEGGMGLVFVAEQTKPMRRKVALKIIKPGMDTSNVVARFEAERQALALMDHPNIARVFDGGETDSGRPFFVMELVKGIPITDYCDRRNLSTRERLSLFAEVCQAVQHAHQKGVIHRDIKPSNVLVTEHGGNAVSKVIDFGVAKATNQQLTDRTVYTAFQQVIGTPLYMSPEQADLSGLDVDTRSDVYSLGVLLYELLTGVTPFDKQRFHKAAFDEIRRIIREEEPPKPSTRVSTLGDSAALISGHRKTEPNKLKQLLFGELDWIVMTALEKDRGRRYESAGSLANDVRAFLSDEPVKACPPSFGYKAQKLFRKHRLPCMIAASFLTILFVSSVIAWTLYGQATIARDEAEELRSSEVALRVKAEAEKVRAEGEQERAETAERSLRERVYDISVMHATNAFNQNDMDRTRRFLRECPEEHRNFEWNYLSAASGYAKYSVHLPDAIQIMMSPDSSKYCAIMSDGAIKCFDAKRNNELWCFKQQTPDRFTTQLTFDRSGKYVAFNSHTRIIPNDPFSATPDNYIKGLAYRGHCLLADSGTEVLSIEGGMGVLFSTNGDAVVTIPLTLGSSSSAKMEIWDIQTRENLFATTRPYRPLSQHAQVIDDAYCFYLQHYGNGVSASCFSTLDGSVVWTQPLSAKLENIALDEDGNVVVFGGQATASLRRTKSDSATVVRLDRESGKVLSEVTSPFAAEKNHAISPSCRTIASVLSDGIAIWDVKTGHELQRIGETAETVTYSTDGHQLNILKGGGTRLDVVDVVAIPSNLQFSLPHTVSFIKVGKVNSLSFDATGKRLVSTSHDDCVRLWNVKSGELQRTLWTRSPTGASFVSESNCLVGSADGLQLWDVDSNQTDRFPNSPVVRALALSSEAREVDVAGHRRLQRWDVLSRNLMSETTVSSIGFSVLRPSIAILNNDLHTVDSLSIACRVTNRNTGEQQTTLHRIEQDFTGFARQRPLGAHPSENIVAIGSGNRIELLQLTEQAQLERIASLRRHTAPVTTCVFLPDGKRLVSGDVDGNLLFWNIESQDVIAEFLEAHESEIVALAVSPDGKTLATGGIGSIRIWETELPDAETITKRIQVAQATKAVNERLSTTCSMENVIQSLKKDTVLSETVRQSAIRIAHAVGDQRFGSAKTVSRSMRMRVWRMLRDGKSDDAAKELNDALQQLEPDQLSLLAPTPGRFRSGQLDPFFESACATFSTSFRIHFLHAFLLARNGQLKEADHVISKSIDLARVGSHEWLIAAELKAFVSLSRGQSEDFQSLCDQIVEGFTNHEDQILRIRAALIVMISDSVNDHRLAKLSWIEQLDSDAFLPIDRRWANLVKGVYAFRRGQFDEAEQRLSDPYFYWSVFGDSVLIRESGFSFLANCFRVRAAQFENQPDEATRLGKLLARSESYFSRPVSPINVRGINLEFPHLRLMSDIVKSEARDSLRKDNEPFAMFWYPTGGFKQAIRSHYEVKWDTSVAKEGKCSVSIEAVGDDPASFASTIQEVRADQYRGKRIKLSAFIKTDIPSGAGSSAIWLRVDGSQTDKVFDNMDNRRIIDTRDWTRVEIVVDIPEDAIKIALGGLHRGGGKAWFDAFRLEVASKDEPLTSPSMSPSGKLTDAERQELIARTPQRDTISNASFEVPKRQLGMSMEGNKVANVLDGSHAERVGIKSGDEILQIDESSIRSVRDVIVAIHTEGTKKQIRGMREGEDLTWTVEFEQ